MGTEHILLILLLVIAVWGIIELGISAWNSACPNCSHPESCHRTVIGTETKSCTKCYDDNEMCIK